MGNASPTVDVWRFENQIELGPNGCWLWTGYRLMNAGGYGTINTLEKRSAVLAHRWSYEYHRSPIPIGLEMDHLCRVPECVNPWHLEPVTHAENMRRMAEAQTHCKQGHEFTPANTYFRAGSGNRTCRACQRRWNREHRARRRAA